MVDDLERGIDPETTKAILESNIASETKRVPTEPVRLTFAAQQAKIERERQERLAKIAAIEKAAREEAAQERL